MVRALVLAAALAVGCGRRAEPEGPAARALATLGAAVDAPPTWELTTAPGGAGAVRLGPAPADGVLLREVPFPPATLDELYATECARAAAPGTRTVTAAGALLVECRLTQTSRAGDTVELVHVASLLRLPARTVKCHFGLAGDDAAAETAAAVCRSLRPQPER